MKKLNKKGFTLVELLAVIIILGLLMVVAASVMGNVQDNAKKSTLETEAKKIMTSITNEAKSLALLGPIEEDALQTSFTGKDGDYYYNAVVNSSTGEVTSFRMCYGKFLIIPTSNTDSEQKAHEVTGTCTTSSILDANIAAGVTLGS